MYIWKPIILALAALSLSGCVGAADTILNARSTAQDYTEEAVERSLEGAKTYCGLVGETRRTELRAATDLGMGPVVEIHCERIPK